MPSPSPRKGRCGAKLRNRDAYCDRYPLKGKGRCKQHGGTVEGRLSSRVDARGATYSAIYAGLQETHRAQLDAILADPNLLDVRRGAGLAQLAISQVPLLPSDEALRTLAVRAKLRSLPPKAEIDENTLEALSAVDPADIEIERQKYIDRSMALIERFHRRQTEAMRQVEAGRLLRQQVVPILEEMSMQLGRLITKYVPEEHRAPFLAAFRARCMQVVTDLSNLADTA